MLPIDIPLTTLFSRGTFYGDVVAADWSRLSAYVDPYTASQCDWENVVKDSAAASTRSELTASLLEYNKHVGVSDTTCQRLEHALQGKGAVVVTGQQPGALGGALMSLYKLLTAIALAEELTNRHGVDVVPLYWVGSDDDDFAEVRDVTLLDGTAMPLMASLPTPAYDIGSAVGSMPGSHVAALWDTLKGSLASHPSLVSVAPIVESALASGDDHGTVSARILAALVGGRCAFVDGRLPELRRSAQGLIETFVAEEEHLRADTLAMGEALEDDGYHAQLSLGNSSGAFLLRDGKRHKVPFEHRDQIQQQVTQDVTQVTPGVKLRNLIQDSVFQPAAVILGPAEFAYRAQLRGVYDRMHVHRPIPFPRLTATFVPTPLVDSIALQNNEHALTLIQRPVEIRDRIYHRHIDVNVTSTAAALKNEFESRRTQLEQAVAAVSNEKALQKFRKRWKDVARRFNDAVESLDELGRDQALQDTPAVAELETIFRVRETSQERYLSVLVPYLFGVWESGADTPIELARVFVTRALDGTPFHRVY